MNRLAYFAGIALLVTAAACSDDDPGVADATPLWDAPLAIDAVTTDAAPPDASGPCPGQAFFTGAYEDWDSTDLSFLGIFDAMYTELGNKTNTASTAPNGRVEMCVATATDATFTIDHATYLDAVFSMDAQANAAGPFAIKGMTPTRADQLFTDIVLTRDTNDAQVIVAVRLHPEDTPVIGAQVSIGNTNDGAFTANASADYVAGDTTTDDSFVLFANTQIDAGSTTVTVTPPNGTTCVGVDSMMVTAGKLAFTAFACSDD